MKTKKKKVKTFSTPNDPFKMKGKFKNKPSVQARKKDVEEGIWYPNRTKKK